MSNSNINVENLLKKLDKEDFSEYSLNQLLVNNGYIRGPKGTLLKVEDMEDEGFPVYEQRHAIHNHRIFRRFIDDEKFERFKKYSVKPNDLIVSTSGTIGKASVIDESDEIGIIVSSLLILRLKEHIINPKYLKYYFESSRLENLLTKNANGVSLKNLPKKSDFFEIPFYIPSLSLQNDIIQLVDSIDKKIIILNEIKQIFNDLKYQLLNDCMNKKYSNKFECSKWRNVSLNSIGSFISGLSGKSKKESGESNQRYISNEVIVDNIFLFENELQSVIFSSEKQQNSIKKYDIIFKLSDTYTLNLCRTSILMEEYGECYLSRSCIGFRINSFDEVNPLFLIYYFQSEKFRSEVFRLIRGGIGSANLAKKEIMNIHIDLPTIEEQIEYVKFISLFFEKERLISEQITDLESFKKTLINKIFI